MWRADPPTCTAASAAAACVNGIRNTALHSAVTSALGDIEKNSTSYRQLGDADCLCDVAAQQFAVPGVSDEDMVWLYEQRLAKASSPARKYYDQLMAAAPHGLCLYCRHAQAATLDHFAPKSPHSALAIEPLNLVPVCARCNHKLGDYWGATRNEQMLHPYFLEPVDRWLHAAITHTDPVTVVFSAQPSLTMPPVLRDRIVRQFDLLGLAEYYSVVSSAELAGVAGWVADTFQDSPGVREFLNETAGIALSVDANDRRGVMYEALAADDWFCKSGYRHPLR